MLVWNREEEKEEKPRIFHRRRKEKKYSEYIDKTLNRVKEGNEKS